MTKAEAAVRLTNLAYVIEGALWEDEGAEMWCAELRKIAAGLLGQKVK